MTSKSHFIPSDLFSLWSSTVRPVERVQWERLWTWSLPTLRNWWTSWCTSMPFGLPRLRSPCVFSSFGRCAPDAFRNENAARLLPENSFSISHLCSAFGPICPSRHCHSDSHLSFERFHRQNEEQAPGIVNPIPEMMSQKQPRVFSWFKWSKRKWHHSKSITVKCLHLLCFIRSENSSLSVSMKRMRVFGETECSSHSFAGLRRSRWSTWMDGSSWWTRSWAE